MKIWTFLENTIKKVLTVLLKLFKITLNDDQWGTIFQFIKFGLVGVSNTVISYGTYAVCIFLGAPYLVANIVSFIISVLNSFFWNNKYVFTKDEHEKRSWVLAMLKTFIAYGATGLVLSSALLILWIDIFYISEYIAPIINLLMTIPLNYIINKFWAFKTKKK